MSGYCKGSLGLEDPLADASWLGFFALRTSDLRFLELNGFAARDVGRSSAVDFLFELSNVAQ